MIVFCTDLSSNIVFFIQTVASVESDWGWGLLDSFLDSLLGVLKSGMSPP
jgi:hypothetical protein